MLKNRPLRAEVRIMNNSDQIQAATKSNKKMYELEERVKTLKDLLDKAQMESWGLRQTVKSQAARAQNSERELANLQHKINSSQAVVALLEKQREEEERENKGSICPYCGEWNVIDASTKKCEHFAGGYDIEGSGWRFNVGEIEVMKKLQQKLEAEYEALEIKLESIEGELDQLKNNREAEESADRAIAKKIKVLEMEQAAMQDVIDEGRGEYESKIIKKIIPRASYVDDAEDVSLGPKHSANIEIMYVSKSDLKQVERYLEGKVSSSKKKAQNKAASTKERGAKKVSSKAR